MKKVFFIGMNRTATKSFHQLFNRSGYKSFHYSCADVTTGQSIILAEEMRNNLNSYKPILHKMSNAQVLSDMFWHREDEWIDGVKYYKELYAEYPDAYFILNTRNMYDWLLSKKTHKKGAYLQRCMQYHNLDNDGMMDWFENDRNKHESAVKTFFQNNERFLRFDIDKDDINILIDHVKPDFFLNEKHWGHHGKTI